MKMKLLFFLIVCMSISSAQLPNGFVYVQDFIPSIKVELRYYSTNNFIGRPVDGYLRDVAILSAKATEALKQIQLELKQENLSIMIYDSYRPQRSVNHFVKWAKNLHDTLNKKLFYPRVKKNELFDRGYIALKSGHTRGSTLDVTLIDLKTSKPLDMGSPYDFFGLESWVLNNKLTAKHRANRMQLQKIMLKYGFISYEKEWWHFTLKDEPFPNVYFDFPVN